MKKIIYILLILMAQACVSEPYKPIEEYANIAAKHRSQEEAIIIASNFRNSFNTTTRSDIQSVERISIIKNHNSRGVLDTLIYAVDYSNSNGYVLISASPYTHPILGYVEKGKFEENATALNENYGYFIEKALEYVANSYNSVLPYDTIIGFGGKYEYTLIDSINPRVEVQWGQILPEGIFCDNKKCGCGPTAIAQIMSYFELPKSIRLSYYESGDSVMPLNWAEIKKHDTTPNVYISLDEHTSYCFTNKEIHESIGHLCRELGAMSSSTYNETVTLTPKTNANAAFMTLTVKDGMRYMYNTCDTNHSKLFNLMVGSQSLALMYGESNNGTAHFWVIDGAIVIQEKYTANPNPITGKRPEPIYTNKYYYRCNWGWYGYSDGYFEPGVFDTEKGIEKPSRADYSNKAVYYFYYMQN